MPRVSSIIAALKGGEVTPAVKGNVDTDQYPHFCNLLENCYVEKHGGIIGRGGSHFVAETKGEKVRLVPFVFSREQSYVMEFGDHYARLFRDNGFITNPEREQSFPHDPADHLYYRYAHTYQYGYDSTRQTGDGVTHTFPYTFDETIYSDFELWVDDIEWGGEFTVDAVSKTFSIFDLIFQPEVPQVGAKIRLVGFIPDTSVIKVEFDGVPVTEGTEYNFSRVDGRLFAGIVSADLVFVKLYIPSALNSVIERPGLNTIINGEFVLEIWTPYNEEDLDGLYWAQANDQMIFTHNKYPPYVLTRYGDLSFEWHSPVLDGTPWESEATKWIADGTETEFKTIWKFASSGDVSVYVNGDRVISGVLVDVTKQAAVFNDAPVKGSSVLLRHKADVIETPETLYPRCVVWFQERLWFAGSLTHPQTLWGSRTADFFDFYVPQTDHGQQITPDSPVEYTIAAYTHEAIEWLSSEAVLVVGTSSTEHRLAPDQFVATDRLPQVSKMTDYGGAHQMPMYMGDQTCFIQRTTKQLRTFKQTAQTVVEQYESIDVTWMASHMTEDFLIKEPYYSLIPFSIGSMIRTDGQIMTVMYDPSNKEESIRAGGWSRQITDGEFKSLCSIPTAFENQIWTAVQRNGQLNIEYFDPDLHVDGGLTADLTSPILTLGNLDHLEGKTVSVVADGKVHKQLVVVNGQVTLDEPASILQIGLPFTKKIQTAPYVEGNNLGTGKGRLGRWSEIFVELYKSARPVVNGVNPRNIEVEEIHNGSVRVFDTGYDRDKLITIEQALPLRLQVVSLFGTFSVHNG